MIACMVSDNQTMRRLIAENAESISGANNAGGSSFYRQADEHSGGFDLDEEELFSIEEAASALIYQDVAIRGPEWAKAAAEMKAAMAQRLPGTSEWNIGNGPGSLKNRSYAEREEDEKEQSLAHFGEMIDQIEEEQERDRERREWATQMHSYAGIEMTGEEWGKLAAALQGNTDARRRLIDALKKDGKSQADAEKEADQIALLAKMQSMPKSDWTPEMWDLHRKLEQDPDLRNQWNGYFKRAADRGAESDIRVDRDVRNADQDRSVDAQADVLSAGGGATVTLETSSSRGRSDFAAAPHLTAEHARAVIATEPLDVPKPVQIASVSVQPSPVVSPGGGFES